MSEISEVYSRETYLPFLAYCQEHSYQTMRDLSKCQFHLLSEQPGFSTLLASRIRAVYTTYCKSSPEAAAPLRPMTEPELVNFLHKYFQTNHEGLVKLDDLVKAVKGRAKRGGISKILQQVPWCRVVDKTTFFYAPAK